MICYLAHPIDAPGPYADALVDMVQYCRTMLAKVTGLSVYDPQPAWLVNERIHLDARLQKVNDAAIESCDFMLAVLPKWSSSIGVPLEIAHAARLEKPVFVIREGVSFALAGLGPSVYTFDDPPRALSAVWSHFVEYANDYEPSPYVDKASRAKQVIVEPEPYVPETQALLTQAHDDDAGFDLYYTGDKPLNIDPGEVLDVPAGAKIQWPPGVWALIIGRSSTFRSRGLLVNVSIIDPGFRGEMFAVTRNVSFETQRINPGERIAQVVPMPLLADRMIPTLGKVDEGTRGSKGFGSSGL